MIARDARYRVFACLANVYLGLHVALQCEAQGEKEKRQAADEYFKYAVIDACQAMLPIDIVNRLRVMQQTHASSDDPVTAHMLVRELQDVLYDPIHVV